MENILSQRDELERLIANQRQVIAHRIEEPISIATSSAPRPPFEEVKSQLLQLLDVCHDRLQRLEEKLRLRQNQHNEDDDEHLTPLSQEFMDTLSYSNSIYYGDKSTIAEPLALDMGPLLSDIGSKESWNLYGPNSLGAGTGAGTAIGTGTGAGVGNDSFERDRSLNDTYEALTRSGNNIGIVLDSLNNEYSEIARRCPPKMTDSFGSIIENLASLAERVPPSAQSELQDLALLMRVTMHELSH